MKKQVNSQTSWEQKAEIIKKRRIISLALSVLIIVILIALLILGLRFGFLSIRGYTTISATTTAQANYSDSQGKSYTSKSNDFTLVITIIDTQAPTAPTNLAATEVAYSQIVLSWTASTDNVGVVGYKIYRDGSQVGTSTVTGYTDSGLLPQTTYSYYVKAYDEAGNISASSNQISITTTQALAETKILGKVTASDGQTAIAGASVMLSIPGRSGKSGKVAVTSTNTAGEYQFTNLSEGSYNITVSKKGYYSQTITINIILGQTLTYNFSLVRK